MPHYDAPEHAPGHASPGHVSPKNVDVVNKMKNNLNHYAEKISKTEYSSPKYWEYHKKIKHLLTNLGTIEINVGTLHTTKIGKVMSKYEKQFHAELADVARENKLKWKSLLTEYRENFKKRAFCREEKIKEEPLSQDSYNNLIASQDSDPPDDFTENSCNQILANSQDFGNMNSNGIPRELEFHTSNTSDEETESDDDSNNNDGNTDEGTGDNEGSDDKSFFIDMRSVVTNVTEALSTVEMECTKMKTMIEYINNKLNDYETKLQSKVKKTHINTKIKMTNGTLKKKDYSKFNKVPVTSSGCSNTISNSRNIDVRESFVKTGKAVMPSLFSPSSTKKISTVNESPKKQSVETPPSIKEKTKVSSGISTSTSTTSHSKKQVYDVCDVSKSDKTCKTSHSSTKQHVNGHNKKYTSLLDNGILNVTSNISKSVDTDVTRVSNTNCNVVENATVPSNNTSLYPAAVKQEVSSDSQDVEFHFHRENAEMEGTLSCVNKNTDKERLNSPQNISEDRSKGTLNNKQDSTSDTLKDLNKKRDNIVKKLNSNSSEKRTKGLRIESVDIRDEVGNVIGKTIKRRPIEERGNTNGSKTGTNKLFKSSVFEIDSDGFTVPNAMTQNILSIPGNTAILKGQQVEGEDVGVNLDEVELEEFMTFSQAVDQSDDIDEVEKDYLLRDKKKNRCSWNNTCKNKEGVRYPVLMKSNGRMKAAHKASTGKKVLKDMLNKKRR